MKRKLPDNGNSKISEEGDTICKTRKSVVGVKLGDLIWIKLHPSSWWPVQIVDADTVSVSVKPNDRSVGEVLVRVYGSYTYLYVDPSEGRAEFKKELNRHHGNYATILDDSLIKVRLRSSETKGQESDASTVGSETAAEKSEEELTTQGGKQGDPSYTRLNNKGHRKQSTAKKNTNKSKKGVDNGTSFQRRVSPRGKLTEGKLDSNLKNENEGADP